MDECKPVAGECRLPAEVIAAAELVGRWFAAHGLTCWELGPCASREELSVLRGRLARYELQAERKHHAPCAGSCESAAYQIETRRLQHALQRHVEVVADAQAEIEVQRRLFGLLREALGVDADPPETQFDRTLETARKARDSLEHTLRVMRERSRLEAALSEITALRPSGAAPKLRRAIEIAQGALREVQK